MVYPGVYTYHGVQGVYTHHGVQGVYHPGSREVYTHPGITVRIVTFLLKTGVKRCYFCS